jgi:diguanylate cyclase (GGDEF)-like protein/PAS domain S-box-containing protein
VNLPFLLLLVASTLLLLALGAWALLLYRATRSTFGGLVLLWGLLLVGGDLFRVSLELHGASTGTSVLLVLSLVGFLVAQVLVLRQLFTSWVGPVLDVFLTGLAVVLTVWSLVLIPAGVGGGGLLELFNLSTATWLLAAVGKLSGQLQPLAPFRAAAVFAFPVLHLAGVMLLLSRSWDFTDVPPTVAIVLLGAAYGALAVTVYKTSHQAPPRVADRSTRGTRLLPYVLVLTAMVVSLGTALARQDDTARAPAFLTLCLVVAVALSVRQILTAEANAALVDALAERERLYRSLVQDSSDLIMIADLDGRLEYVSPASELVLGAHGDKMVGRPVAEVLGLPEPELKGAIRATVDDGLHQRLDSRLTLADGVRSLESVVSVRGHTLVLNVRDVTERALLREQLHEMAFHDPLTGLFNRARVLQSIEARMVAWRSGGGDAPALLFLDLDGFKGVNDVAGHAVGDEVLRLVSARLTQIAPGGAVLGRLGGDEFVVLLIAATYEEALAEAERIAEGISQSYTVAEGSFVIGVSIGVAHGTDVQEAEELLRNADLAMYTAKRTRRRTQAFEPSMHTAAVRRADSDMVHAAALDHGRTELYYQPIVMMDTEMPVGVEALLKWRTEDGVLRESGPLLEYAERSGRMGAVSGWVVGTALDQVADWREDLGLVSVSVNLAPVDLLRHGLVRSLRDELAMRGLPASVLTIEITEQVLMQDPDRAIRVITDLRSLGIRVSIDDFGTGFSSLAYLVDLPVDALKIDRSFVQALPRAETARVVVAGIIKMARELGVMVVAEGIETVEQRELLVHLGNPLCQGYLFSPPLSADAVARLIFTARAAQSLRPVAAVGDSV